MSDTPSRVSPSATAANCPFAKSDMTPCVIRDGEICRSDDGVCVGCERRVPQFRSMSEKRRYVYQIAERIADDTPRSPSATRVESPEKHWCSFHGRTADPTCPECAAFNENVFMCGGCGLTSSEPLTDHLCVPRSPSSPVPSSETDGRIIAPWTPEQVRALNEYQKGPLHPFTCGAAVEHTRGPDEKWEEYEARRTLIATQAGWICPTCDYMQDWAHSFMARSAACEGCGQSMSTAKHLIGPICTNGECSRRGMVILPPLNLKLRNPPPRPPSRGTEEEFGELLDELEAADRAFAVAEYLRQDTEDHAKRADDATAALQSYVSRLREERDAPNILRQDCTFWGCRGTDNQYICRRCGSTGQTSREGDAALLHELAVEASALRSQLSRIQQTGLTEND